MRHSYPLIQSCVRRAERDDARVPRSPWRMAAASGVLLLLTACGGVKVAPTPALPPALVERSPAKVGVLLAGDQKNYRHSETRGGVEWAIELGAGHEKLARDLFSAAFRDPAFVDSLDQAAARADLAAVFEPRIEQYSFATARETGGDYVAVTIRYRINLYAPDGSRYDSFTLTGYGNSLAGGMSSADPLDAATRSAMRDAAAKFLTQFPAQPVAAQLARGEKLVVAAGGVGGTANAPDVVEVMPIKESASAPAG